MKKVVIALSLFVSASFAQAQTVPTNGLASRYDMVTITGGTTLVDSSGNAHNGTLSGTTPGSKGVAFNGTTDYISIPSVVGNSDFTTFVCASVDTNQGSLWSEKTTADASNGSRFTRENAFFDSATSSASISLSIPSPANDWHCYYMRRSGASITFGIPDLNIIQTADGGTGTVTSGSGALGAQHWGGGTNAYFQGTIGYVYIYTRALTATEISSLYNATKTALASRSVFLRDIVGSVFPGRVWQRQGRIIGPNVADNTISHTTTDCQLIANPCFQMWYDKATNMYYSEAPEITSPQGYVVPGAWTETASPIATNYTQGQVAKVSGQSYKYLMLATPNPHTNSKDALTSNDPIHFSLARANALPSGGAGAWDQIINNSSPPIQVGGVMYVAYDGQTGSQPYLCGGATSTDGLTWTKASANPISGYGQLCNEPFLWNDPSSGLWHMWGHGADTGGILRFSSTTFNSIWNGTSPGSIFGNAQLQSFPTLAPSAPDETSQMTCPSLVEVGGVTYMGYCASDASNVLWIKLAIAPMTMHQLTQTGEGDAAPQP